MSQDENVRAPHQEDADHPAQDKERDALGGLATSARHRPDGETTTTASEAHGERERRDLPGPPGEVNTRAAVVHEDDQSDERSTALDGADEMTAAEQSGQVAYGAGQPTGEEGATGAESSSG